MLKSAVPLLLFTLGTWPVFAQSGGLDLVGDEGFTIQAATKTEIPVSKAPSSVTVITSRQIRDSGARSIPELLRLVAGVNVRWNPMVQNIDIRGFGQTPFTSRVLLLIDGTPYNSWDKGGFPQHPGFDFYMLQNVKRLEIVRGPGSSLYGENAYWGVINIVTFSGEDLEGGRVELFGGDLENQSLSASYGAKLGEDGSIFVSARANKGQLPMAFWFEKNDAAAEGTDFFLKTTYKSFEFSYYRHEDEFDGFSENLGPGVFVSSENIGQTVNIAALKTRHEVKPDVFLDAKLTFANRYGSHCAACHGFPQNPQEFGGQSDHGSQILGEFSMNFRNIPAHDILVGVEGRRIEAGDHADELEINDPRVDLEYTKFAAYVQDQISLADDKVRITLGARYDGETDVFEDEISPRAAIVFSPNERWAFRAGWSTAFRFPNFSEQYQNTWFIGVRTPSGFAFPFANFGENLDLKREEIRTIDAGAEWKINEAWTAKLDFYQSTVKDFIVISVRPPSGPFGVPELINENHPGEATVEGLEFELRYRAAKGFNAFVNWATQDASREDDRLLRGQPIEFSYIPENKVNFGAYWGPFRGFSGSLEAQWRDDVQGPVFYNSVTGGNGHLEAYTRAGVRLSYDVPLKLGRSSEALRFSIYGKNLLDEEIVETYLPINMEQPGRTYYGAIELRY